MKRLFPILFLLPLPLSAQGSSPNDQLPVWQAPISSLQGEFTVNLNSICAVALEEYVLEYEGEDYPVVECSIHTLGGKTARFYYIDERDSERRKKEEEKEKENDSGYLAPLTKTVEALLPAEDDEDAEQKRAKLKVVKVYPLAATVNNVEYRLRSEEAVRSLYNNLRKRWTAIAP